MPDSASSSILEKVYTSTNNNELEAAYDEWAADYDAHVTSFGWKSPAVVAGLFGRYVGNRDARILDAGAGTGMMGELLMIMGFGNQIGIDLSKGMLDQAQKTGAYTELRRMVLGEPLDFPDNHFDACQSIGVFTAGHAPAASFDELVRIVAPGGYILFSLLKDISDEGGFQAKFDALASEKRWELVEKTPDYSALPYEDPDIIHNSFVFQVLA
ncbi:class I SAM-dependent DNA methyltransferase [Desulfohalovibrio reitneri]|uniref:class I SAM-dependent DNA methyltransferase n=1 Tax=Desulfohalovibrio reitneri TaxID=1307759 RepID=UPI0004A72B84|nr:class I SAM-dependent methyltransferase [Desulfohalovibrio reitneri]